MAEEQTAVNPYDFHCQLISKGCRADGRTLDETRDVKLEFNAIRTADSSSLVKLGNTSLVCGCTSRLIKAKEKNDDEENINVRLELPPICSNPTGKRTQHSAQILTKMLKDILDGTKCLDYSCLYVSEIDSYWSIDVEVICLNYDGCLLDAALLAVISALKSLRLTNKVEGTPPRIFQLNSLPICSTFAIIGDQCVRDPNLEEEAIAQSTFAISTDATSNGRCHISKIGGKSISVNQLTRCLGLAREKSHELKLKIVEEVSAIEQRMECS